MAKQPDFSSLRTNKVINKTRNLSPPPTPIAEPFPMAPAAPNVQQLLNQQQQNAGTLTGAADQNIAVGSFKFLPDIFEQRIQSEITAGYLKSWLVLGTSTKDNVNATVWDTQTNVVFSKNETSGLNDNALLLNNTVELITSDIVDIFKIPNIANTGDVMTISFSFRTSSALEQITMFGVGSSTTDQYWAMRYVFGPRIEMRDSLAATASMSLGGFTPPNIADGEWHNIFVYMHEAAPGVIIGRWNVDGIEHNSNFSGTMKFASDAVFTALDRFSVGGLVSNGTVIQQPSDAAIRDLRIRVFNESDPLTINAPPLIYAVVLGVGEVNTAGDAPAPANANDNMHPAVRQWDRQALAAVRASHPLKDVTSHPGAYSPVLGLVNQIAHERGVPDGITILIYPACEDDTGFEDGSGSWAVGGARYTDITTFFNVRVGNNGSTALMAVVGTPGETDAKTQVNADAYAAQLNDFVTNAAMDWISPFQGTGLADTAPVYIIQDLVNDNDEVGRLAVTNAKAGLETILNGQKIYFVSGKDFVDTGDNETYDSNSLVELGNRFYARIVTQ